MANSPRPSSLYSGPRPTNPKSHSDWTTKRVPLTDPARLLGRGLSRQQVMARAARHRESDAASRRAYVWADVATRFGGTSEGLARICRCSINVVLAEPGL